MYGASFAASLFETLPLPGQFANDSGTIYPTYE